MVKEKELAKVKEDNKLLVRHFWDGSSKISKTATQVRMLLLIVFMYVCIYSCVYMYVTIGSVDPAGVVRQW